MYIIEEWQSQSLESPVSIATPVQKENYNEAEGEFLIKQGYACMSSVPYHMVRLSDTTGFVLMQKCYTPDRLAPPPNSGGGDG